MKFHQLQENSKCSIGLPPKAGAASDDDDGAAIALAGQPLFRSGLALCHVGAATGSPSSFSIVFTLEAAGSDNVFTAVSGKTATRTAAGLSEIAFDPNALPAGTTQIRMNRTVSITGGSTPTVPTSSVVILSAPSNAPVS